MREILSILMERMAAGKPTTYCRLVETRGSTPQKPGAMMLVFPNGDQAGTLGGGCVEAEVKRRAISALQSQRAEIASFQLDHDYGWDDGLICGGRMNILMEPLNGAQSVEYFRELHKLICAGRLFVAGSRIAGYPSDSGPNRIRFTESGAHSGPIRPLSLFWIRSESCRRFTDWPVGRMSEEAL